MCGEWRLACRRRGCGCLGQWSGLPGSLLFELPPPSPASSEGSTGMVPIAVAIVALVVDET